MYSPYGSYSSTSAPMEIGAGSYLSRPQHHFSDTSCAFPSWPRRSSLSESERGEERATSFLSDEDLFPSSPDVFDDDARSVSSSGSSSAGSPIPGRLPSNNNTSSDRYDYFDAPAAAEADEARLEARRQQMRAYQLEAMRQAVEERDRRRAAMKQRQRRPSAGSKKSSPKAKGTAAMMAPIAE
ncbi:hypothetical protein GGTG_11167 [Gaeumannomyces tritici R3-111a-1]|uniref:Uncharacterized protein n=1 Tax=Gaeumannomyces tritici (strain R3-111a-1) TaxID=644352 RepID=J3PCE4_GAET3|nr:hypothetical protein GGTG_11167 [Gaeumannomyces tritici R3-111a-1]EJT71914.1 hypothetical protein GGTG_11167 [Gaeumannomyces tritici R3-111a-1]